MTNTIKVMPNQSMLDVILQGCGTLEGSMQMMAANEMSISDCPDVGTLIKVNSEQIVTENDPSVLQYLQQNGIVIGTLVNGNILDIRVVLKPVLQVVPTTTIDPSVTGDYEFDFKAASGFINVYTIPHAHYPSNNNMLYYLSEDRYVAHDMPYGNLCVERFMDNKLLHYNFMWAPGSGFMLAWVDLGAYPKTATFVDVKGNEAYVAPLIVLDNVTQNVEEYLIADLLVELVSATRNLATLRLTRSHHSISHADFVSHTMSWLNDAAGGAPDPLDPTNPDKTIIVLPRGSYSFGVATLYINGSVIYPPSAFTEVVEIA